MNASERQKLQRRDERVRAMLDEAIRSAESGEQVDADALRIIRAQLDEAS